jgi:hypothetical protein
MGDTAVLDMNGEPVTPKRKQRKERETISCIEERPRPDWFVQMKSPDGKTWWFLRVSITGLRTRIYGPFATQHRALLFWDRIISGATGGGLFDCISEADNRLNEYAVPTRRFQNRGGHYPIIENDLYLQTKGQ